jgi:hypothetical protein
VADRQPFIRWPGVEQPISCVYTLSHGVSAGAAILTILPQDVSRIAVQGDLVLGDGVGEVRLRNCKVASLRTSLSGSGFEWTLQILDRRWRWTTTGSIDGVYNVIDATRDVTRPQDREGGPFITLPQHYLPWTMRSPHDLIKLCLEAMGERNYVIDAPNTLYPLPAINWDATNPAQALSQLCDTLGCRVVYRPAEDAVWIVPLGKGRSLPDGSIARESPGITSPQRPDAITFIGAPAKFQIDWRLRPVGEEWDGSLVPIEDLSYAPTPTATRHVVQITPANATVADVFSVTVELGNGQSVVASHTATTTTEQDVVDDLAGKLTALLAPRGFEATAETGYIQITGPASGKGFTVRLNVDGTGTLSWELTTRGAMPTHPWANSGFTGFHDVRSTDRLTYQEARDRANKCIYRWYRIENLDVTTGLPPVSIPYYGELDIIQRVVLLNEQLTQIVPTDESQQVQQRGLTLPVARDFYDGLFHWLPARAYGRHTRSQFGLFRPSSANDAGPDDEVLTELSLDVGRQLVVFSEPVFRYDSPHYYPGDIRLRCACHLRDRTTNQLVRYRQTYTFPGPKLGTQPAVIRHDDVEFLVRRDYEATTSAGGVTQVRQKQVLVNADEVLVRARYYLSGAILKYQQPVSGDRAYNGIVPVYCDGKIHQVTWMVTEGAGADTIATVDGEHSVYIPQHPERLQAEYLQAASRRAQPGEPVKARDMMRPGGAPGGGYVSGGWG